ncbi:hypothetical protein [Paenarthrobacter sp. C1]|uniref:hypothetical protein n=1 Tax=Paenarthrobacter sp. C1 TaxID=3400220 RepID=UPI003BF59439
MKLPRHPESARKTGSPNTALGLCSPGAVAAGAPFIAAQALDEAAADLQESVDVIRVRSYDAGIDNNDTLHAMTTDLGWLQHRAAELRPADP